MSSIPAIKGYRPLQPEMIELANKNKLIEELVLRQLDQHLRAHDSQEIDQRWVALARTHLQMGFMALNRAVFKPARIEGELNMTTLIEGLSQ
jgi:hypothetical protein